MRIGILAEQLGTTAPAIRFYERRGLLPAPGRSENRYREYSEAGGQCGWCGPVITSSAEATWRSWSSFSRPV